MRTALPAALGLAAALLFPTTARAQGEGAPEQSQAQARAHGGEVVTTQAHQFEVVFRQDHMRIYIYDLQQQPISCESVKGTVLLQGHDGAEIATLDLTHVPADPASGDNSEYLEARHDFSSLEPSDAVAVISLEGLSGDEEPAAEFRARCAITEEEAAAYVCPMGCPGGRSESSGTCPSCGMELRRSGGPAEEEEQEGGNGNGGGSSPGDQPRAPKPPLPGNGQPH